MIGRGDFVYVVVKLFFYLVMNYCEFGGEFKK